MLLTTYHVTTIATNIVGAGCWSLISSTHYCPNEQLISSDNPTLEECQSLCESNSYEWCEWYPRPTGGYSCYGATVCGTLTSWSSTIYTYQYIDNC